MKATKPKSLFAKAAKFALAALLVGALAFTGCSSGDDDDDDGNGGGSEPSTGPSNPTNPDGDEGGNGDDENYPYIVYKENFATETVAHGWGAYVNGFNAAPERGTVTVADGYLQLKPTGAVFFATATKTEPNTLYAVPKDTDYKLTFDLLLPTGGGKAHTFAISNANGFAGFTDGKDANPQSGAYMIKDNTLLSLVQTDAAKDTWTLNDDKTVTLTLGEWYSFTVEVVGDKTYLTATPKSSVTTAGIARTEFTTNGGGLGAFYYATNGASGTIGFDNIVIRTKNDAIASVDISGDETISAAGTTTLTATATTFGDSPITYAWSLASEDTTYAKIVGATTGASITIEGTNNTITKHTAHVTLTLSIGDAVAATKTYPLTVKALESLLSDITLSAESLSKTESGGLMLTMSAGENVTLTANATAKKSSDIDAEAAEVKFTCEDTDNVTATVAGTTITLTGAGVTDGEVIIVTATAGDVTKSVTITVKVKDAALESVKIEGAETLLYGVRETITLKAVITPPVAGVTYNWEVSEGGNYVVIDGDKDKENVTIAIKNPTDSAKQTATVKVTAIKDDAKPTATHKLTVKAPTKNVLFSQDYEKYVRDTSAKLIGTTTLSGDDLYLTAYTADDTTGTKVAQSFQVENNKQLYNIFGIDNLESPSTDSLYKDYGKYLHVAIKTTGGTREAWTSEDLKVPTSGSYVMEFDLALNPGNQGEGLFHLINGTPKGGNGISDKYVFELVTTSSSGKDTTTDTPFTWTITGAPEGNNTVSLKSMNFYHYKLEVDIDNKTVAVTITDPTQESGEPLFHDSIEVKSYVAQYFVQSYQKSDGRSAFLLDNIEVYTYSE